jgi:mono/diheme cytochrome c family protein
MKQKYGLGGITAVALLLIWFLFAPPRFWLNLTKPVDLTDPVTAGAQMVEKYDCRSCHRLAGQGSLIAPALDDVALRLDDVSLRLWLRNPRAIRGNTAMPNFRMSDSEIEAVVAYLESLAAE